MRLRTRLWHLLITPYEPRPEERPFLDRAQTQQGPRASATVAVLDARESDRFFGVPLARRGMQPVFLKVENRSSGLLRLQLVKIDPNYYTPLEAAVANHFSIARRRSGNGDRGRLLRDLVGLVPLKLVSAYRANRRMDALFREHGFRLRPLEPGEVREGFVFTPIDVGTKVVHVLLETTRDTLSRDAANAEGPIAQAISFTFSIPVPGISADYLRRDLQSLESPSSLVDCDVPTLVCKLSEMPPATTNAGASRGGDPANLVVIGRFETLLAAFAARWDESETITLATCWKTVRAFLLGAHYRYSPVSPLYLFGRSQDVALQRTRHSINDRLHLRLWLTPLVFRDKPVWVGQVSRDIGVRFTTRTWNLTTHRIDPDVDEARDYVVEDLLQAQHVDATGYVDGVGRCDGDAPRRNLTGDLYTTDGRRAVILLSPERTEPRFVAWSSWS